MPRCDAGVLAERMAGVFDAAGLAAESRRHVVASMIETSLRGVDSHGIQLFPHYVRALAAGRINARPKFVVERSRASTATLDADHAFGHHAGSAAIALARQLAAETGVGVVGVRNSTHFGAAAYFALQASRAGDIGIALTNADSLVRAANSREAVFGTNPVCFTAPMQGEDPFCLDMATSRVSWNRILIRRRDDQALEPGWAADASGLPTTDPAAAAMLEAAGDYKGFGLGFMVEVLCGLLAGGPVAREILPMYRAPISARRHLSHFFVVLRVDAFGDPEEFQRRLRGLADLVRGLAPGRDAGTVMAPGDPEKMAYAERSRAGIPVDTAKFDEFLAIDRAFERAVLS